MTTRHKASVLVGILWCVAVLSVVVVGALYSVRLDLRIARNHGDAIQAHYLALAGIEKAKALLYQEAAERKRSRTHHSGALYDSPEDFREVSLGRGHFSVLRHGKDDEAAIVYGVADEESRLNINRASPPELQRLYGMTPEIAAALIDWRDGNNTPSNGGAEAEYYATLQPPYLPRNAPFKTVREITMVRGITSADFKGEDENLNGWLDPEEDDGSESVPVDNADGMLDAGWSALFTTDSSVQNIDAAGETRINAQSAGERELVAVSGITPEIAKAIIDYRGRNQIDNLTDLLDVTAPPPPNQPVVTSASVPQDPPQNRPPARGRTSSNPQTGNSSQPAGPKVIDEALFMDIADHFTAESEQELPGVININTASVDVLACLPALSRELAQAIVSHRRSAGFFPSVAHLLKVDGMNRQILEQLGNRVSVRSETFRIRGEGTIPSSGARRRVEMIVRLGASGFQTLAYREDL